MRNPEVTKQLIIKTSANLFNTKGYKATSISDITKATGLTKGAIYRHFQNKQDLERQALRSLSKVMFDEIGTSIKAASNFRDKIEAIFKFFENYLHTPLYDGGCPLLNAAVESDDANPVLREQTFNMLSRLRMSMETLLRNALKNNQISIDIDIDYYSTIFIATLEGGIMMSKLERNTKAIKDSIKHLRSLVDQMAR